MASTLIELLLLEELGHLLHLLLQRFVEIAFEELIAEQCAVRKAAAC